MPMAQKGDRTLDPGDDTEPRVPDENKPISSSNPPESRGQRRPPDASPLTNEETGEPVGGEPADPNVPDVTETTDISSPRRVPPEQQAVNQPTAKAPSPTKTSGGQTTTTRGNKSGTKTS